jgi:hypothetical protein
MVDIAVWQRAEAHHAVVLARAAEQCARCDTRISMAPAGMRQRLALLEASALLWHTTGVRLESERLGLWLAGRWGAERGDGPLLALAAWGYRRLLAGPRPLQDLEAFLGTTPGEALKAWGLFMGQAKALHPLSQACLAHHIWPGSRGQDRFRAGIAAALIAGVESDIGFAPMALGSAVSAGGASRAIDVSLSDGLSRVKASAHFGVRMCDDILAWRVRALEAPMGHSSTHLPQLISTLAHWPYLSAPMAEGLAQISRATAQRLLLGLEKQGLIREITGQKRYRFWCARL